MIISLVDEDLIEDEEVEGSSSTPLAPVGGVPSLGGEDGAGLLFPLPGGGHLEEAEDLENSVDPDDYSEETTGDVGPSDPNVIQAGSSCQVLVSDFGELLSRLKFSQFRKFFSRVVQVGSQLRDHPARAVPRLRLRLRHVHTQRQQSRQFHH